MRFLIITGMSGAGKATAMHHLEDLGALCVDNLLPVMMPKFIKTCQTTPMQQQVVALSVDTRSGDFFDAEAVVHTIEELRQHKVQIDVVFVEANKDTIVSRYKESRRDHPLAAPQISLEDAITRESDILAHLREVATYVIDTSGMRPKKLLKELRTILGETTASNAMRIELLSFGFKRGVPRQADLMFDVRILPNPFYVESLCRRSGLEPDVSEFVMSHETTKTFMAKTTDLLDFILPHYKKEGRHRLVIGIGCTGGMHRSVAIAEAIGCYLREKDYPVDVQHRDVELEQARWKNSDE